jgi:hypothetical protein
MGTKFGTVADLTQSVAVCKLLTVVQRVAARTGVVPLETTAQIVGNTNVMTRRVGVASKNVDDSLLNSVQGRAETGQVEGDASVPTRDSMVFAARSRTSIKQLALQSVETWRTGWERWWRRSVSAS